MNLHEASELIRHRRSVYAAGYSDRAIDPKIIEQILENANWAPSHQKTDPWRFVVFTDSALMRLSDYLGDWYLENTKPDAYSAIKEKKLRSNPLKSQAAIAIFMKRDEQERVAEWEELAAVSCAVQNIWLSCAAAGIGGYWSSHPAALTLQNFITLDEELRCLGLFFMGYPEGEWPKMEKESLKNKVQWLNK